MKVEEGKGLVVSDATEFVRNLKTESEVPDETSEEVKKEDSVKKDDDMQIEEEALDQIDDAEMKYEHESESDTADNDQNKKLLSIIEEPLVASGMGATLALLKQKGAIESRDEESRHMDSVIQEREKWLQEQKQLDSYIQEQVSKAKEDAERRGYRMTRREQSEMFEKIRARELEKRFKSYQPTVKLEYKDQYGRDLDPKEVSPQI